MGDKACTYDWLSLLLDLSAEFLPLFLKNFNFFKTSMLDLGEIEGGTLDIFAFLPMFDVLVFLKE